MKRLIRLASVPAAALLLATASSGQILADFKLPDANPTSPRFGEEVSPRDYRHQVSLWYFGSAL